MKHVTFDIDWAPEWCVNETLELLENYSVKATFFITHDCPSLERIREYNHNIGLHPNLYPNSDHGKTPSEAISKLIKLAPEAESIRTHGLVQSSRIFQEIFSTFPQLKYDLSILMYGFPYIGKFPWVSEGTEFERINYNWEDDCAFFDNKFDWLDISNLPDNIIFDFHPIHLALNSDDLRSYQLFKKSLGNKPLNEATKSDIKPFINSKLGANTFLSHLLKRCSDFVSFSELLCELE